MRLIKQKMCMVDPAFRMAVALAFTFCTGYAQSSDPRDQANRLRDAFSVAPPEISADGLIRPSSKSELFRAGERTEMLETAFGMANRARLPGRAIPAVTAAFNTDSDAGVAVSVSQLGLDRASLLAKGIAVLGETDPRAARIRLLASLSNLRPEYSCADAIVYSNAPLFAEASKLTLRGFSPDERRKRKDRDFALEIVRSATSPIDIRGTLLFIAALESWPSRERTDLEDMLWANTGGMRGNYRASGGSLVDGLASHLANNIESTGAGVALRMFLDAQVRANPCVEGSNPKSGESKRVLSIVEWFEAKLRPRFPGLQEVTYPTSFDGDIGPAAIVRKYWSPPESRELLLLMKRLRFGDAQQQRVLAALPLRADGRAPFLSDNDRGSAEWIAQAKEAMGRSE